MNFLRERLFGGSHSRGRADHDSAGDRASAAAAMPPAAAQTCAWSKIKQRGRGFNRGGGGGKVMTTMKTVQDFWDAYHRLSEVGKCDSPGGGEYEPVIVTTGGLRP